MALQASQTTPPFARGRRRAGRPPQPAARAGGRRFTPMPRASGHRTCSFSGGFSHRGYPRSDVNMLIAVYDAATSPNPLTGDRLWGVYTVSNGARARRLYELRDAGVDIADHWRATFERLRPSLKGRLVLEE